MVPSGAMELGESIVILFYCRSQESTWVRRL